MKTPTVAELLQQTLKEHPIKPVSSDTSCIIDDDFDMSEPAVPWIPGLYARFSTKPQYLNYFKTPKSLYYLAPTIDKNNILENGIQRLKSETLELEYSKRIYCFIAYDVARFKQFVNTDKQFICNADGTINFTVFEIDPLKTTTNFYSDSNIPDDVYCYCNIPSDAIRAINDLTTR